MSREFDELLSAYLDGEVTPEERATVERRLEQSPSLRETLEELSEVGELVRSLPRARAPVDLPERVVAAIDNKPLAGKAAADGSARWLRAWPLLAAGTVLAVGVAIVVSLPKGGGPNVAGKALAPAALPELATADRRLSEDGTRLATESYRDFDIDGAKVAEAESSTESLTERIRKLDRPPAQGDVIDILKNSPQTHVVRYYVVDTRRTADSLKVILADNQLDIVETETKTSTPALVNSADQDTMYWYFEGPSGNVDNALEKIRTLKTVNGVVDEGSLAQDGEAPVTLDFGERVPSTNDDMIRLRDESIADQPAGGALGGRGAARKAAAGSEVAPATPALSNALTPSSEPAPAVLNTPAPSAAPAPAPQEPASVAASKVRAAGQADKKQLEDAARPVVVGKEEFSKSVAGEQPTDPESKFGRGRGDAYGAAPANPAPQSNSRGVSAQLDSQSVEPLMRNRFSYGNAFQQNSVPLQNTNQLQYTNPQQNLNQLQRSQQPEFNVPQSGREKQRGATEAEQLKELKAKDSFELKQETPEINGQLNFRQKTQAVGNNFRAGATGTTKVLLILQNGAPDPAAATPAAAVPAAPLAPAPVPAQKPSN